MTDFTDRRAHPREATNIRARVFYGPTLAMWADCVIADLSQGGAKLKIPEVYPLSPRFVLLPLEGSTVYEVRLRWRRGDLSGVAFDERRDISAATDARYAEIRKTWEALKGG